MALSRQPLPEQEHQLPPAAPGPDLSNPLLQRAGLLGNAEMQQRIAALQTGALTAARELPTESCRRAPAFGLSMADDILADDGELQGIANLYGHYKSWGGQHKAQAKANFTGKEGQIADQTTYSHALKRGERRADTFEALLQDTGYTMDSGRILGKDGRHLANLLTGDDAYAVKTAADDSNGLRRDVLTRHMLPGLENNKEYVKVGDTHLKRGATRGITPHEREDYMDGRDLRPFYYSDDELRTPKTGVHYWPDGSHKLRDRGKGGRPKRTDLDLLKGAGADRDLDEVPLNRHTRSFVQERLGVNKVLSGTSVDANQLTSNHGGGFGAFGSVDVDLARVPTDAILHSYKESMQPGLPAEDIRDPARMNEELQRAEETALRNRELHFDHLPHDAITGFHESDARLDYEDRFRSSFRGAYGHASTRGHRYARPSCPLDDSAIDRFMSPRGYTERRGGNDGGYEGQIEGQAARPASSAPSRSGGGRRY